MSAPAGSFSAIKTYCNSLTAYSRRKTIEVNIGDLPLGSMHPIRIQSMTTVDTMDTIGSVEQSIRMIDAGCEYVRITAPSLKEAENLRAIRDELHRRGYKTPLIADIHFTPNAAELAARIVEKVRVNPGNYADKKKFQQIEYTDIEYQAELDRIREKFSPLVKICKEYGTAMRIGTNHGSLSDRIMSRYGDTPLGMVESALEFLRICEDLDYHNIVLSMKASNTQVMVEAYRLLVHKLEVEGLMPYPLHLGVTEAGEAEDGRIKSAVGIGTLLEDGLGDTIRVSLTEDPEYEVPVARSLAERYTTRAGHMTIPAIDTPPIDPYVYSRRNTREVRNFGAQNVPRVITDVHLMPIREYKDLECTGHFYLPATDKFAMNDHGTDYIYTGANPVQFMLPMGLKEIVDYRVWSGLEGRENRFPLMSMEEWLKHGEVHSELNFLVLTMNSLSETVLSQLVGCSRSVIVLDTGNGHGMPEQRRAFFELMNHHIDLPVVIRRKYADLPEDALLLYSSTDIGGLLIDGLGDGAWLDTSGLADRPEADWKKLVKFYNSTTFGILQAARTRMTKTEYISCPSCGRTLFDLQETTAKIRKRTDHLKGVKIGIMGCIVNGPGEMADADYGYVGSGVGKITLYRGKEIVKRNVPAGQAVDELIGLIAEDGRWIEAETLN